MKTILGMLNLCLLFTQVLAQEVDVDLNSNAIGIDHVPIVVSHLGQIKEVLGETLRFKIKDGKVHEGIENCFVKFEDGTYLEFTMPVDATPDIGKYYTDFLKQRQGGTAMAIRVKSAEVVKNELQRRSISFNEDRNKYWRTIEPTPADLFYIQYDFISDKDRPVFSNHPNGSQGLQAVWFFSKNLRTDLEKYKRLGFKYAGKESLPGNTVHRLTVGESTLYLVDSKKGSSLTNRFFAKNMTGIGGFTIKVEYMSTLKLLLSKDKNVRASDGRILYFLNEYNLFFEFVE